MTPRAKASEDTKAEAVALALVVGDTKAAEQLGIPRRTVSSWRAKAEATADPIVLETKEQLVDLARDTAARALYRLRERIDDPSARVGELASALRVLVEAGQLLAGEATARIESTSVVASVNGGISDEERLELREWLTQQIGDDVDVE